MTDFARPAHRTLAELLRCLDDDFLGESATYFGGGTRIVLELGEYRESRDIDFLCASREGYRALRETVSGESLGRLAKAPVRLARQVRADQYGVRTWVQAGELRIKFEIFREARIELAGGRVPAVAVPCLDRVHAFAEKLLANADRGLDDSTLSRDAVDLAFMVEGWGLSPALGGAAVARTAYGTEVDEKLSAVVARLGDRRYRNACVEGLGLADTRTLARGLTALGRGLAAATS